MPAPAEYVFDPAVLVAAHQAVLDEVDAGASNAVVKAYTEDDTLLVTMPLTDPAGSVNGTTGQLTLTGNGTGTAVATGDCTYGTLCDSDGNVILTLPAQAGASAVSGKLVLGSLAIATGAEVEIATVVIG